MGSAEAFDVKASAQENKDSTMEMLQAYGVKTNKFGKNNAKTFDEFCEEIQGGSARLMLDATQHKQVVRVVEVVLVRIVCGQKILIQTDETMADGRKREGIHQLP